MHKGRNAPGDGELTKLQFAGPWLDSKLKCWNLQLLWKWNIGKLALVSCSSECWVECGLNPAFRFTTLHIRTFYSSRGWGWVWTVGSPSITISSHKHKMPHHNQIHPLHVCLHFLFEQFRIDNIKNHYWSVRGGASQLECKSCIHWGLFMCVTKH